MMEIRLPAIGGGLRDMINVFRDLREFVPMLMEILDCLRELTPQDRQRVARIAAARLCDSEEDREKLVQQIVSLGDNAVPETKEVIA